MGASLALQDARVLAQELATGLPDDVSGALSRFEERRRGDATRVQREAWFESAVLFLEAAPLRQVRNRIVERTPLFEWFLKRRATETAVSE
jgi:2-polyprenyl-6-methoxyphenol hydroxylase-like FAD-dependent oxidoreductase